MGYDDDSRDGILFRFWIRAASYPGGFPAALMRALKDCHTPADYRRALNDLAKEKGVNLPPHEPASRIIEGAGEATKELRDALRLVLDGTEAHDFPSIFGISEKEGRRLRKLAGLPE
ncbi:hypothetical protein [Brucella anthropi]|uniref:hypothetical protein n=1 Tax=Brucella anthropi TaxID=529 RepID=UPI00124C511B|nr:hypothetical protein [Brucella anthropi]KAB2752309.1 hypothetical protein F9L05_04135 [Brucella anthropi]